jgi:hypothetical protein
MSNRERKKTQGVKCFTTTRTQTSRAKRKYCGVDVVVITTTNIERELQREFKKFGAV